MTDTSAPRRPNRTFRCEDQLWDAMNAKCKREGIPTAEMIRLLIRKYVNEKDKK